jgi:hypothetical protein
MTNDKSLERKRRVRSLMLDDERRHSQHQDRRSSIQSSRFHKITTTKLSPLCQHSTHKYLTMASAKSFALKALRSNIAGQRLSKTVPAQFQNSLVKPQPFQLRAPRPAFVPVRWHSIPASARSKDYDFTQVKEFASSPSEDRLLIGTTTHPIPSP